MTKRGVENTRVHVWTFLPVSVKFGKKIKINIQINWIYIGRIIR